MVSAAPLAALVLSVLVPQGPVARGPLASTYDEAACATLQDGDDDWGRSAIGENEPPSPNDCPIVAPRAAVASDCHASPYLWVGEMIGTCDMPRRDPGGPAPRLARAGAERRAHRLLVELATGNGRAPVTPLPEHKAQPALLPSAPALAPPSPAPLLLLAVHVAPLARPTDELLRPPRA